MSAILENFDALIAQVRRELEPLQAMERNLLKMRSDYLASLNPHDGNTSVPDAQGDSLLTEKNAGQEDLHAALMLSHKAATGDTSGTATPAQDFKPSNGTQEPGLGADSDTEADEQATDGLYSFTDFDDEKREQVVLQLLREEGRFLKMKELQEALETRGIEASRYVLSPLLSQIKEDGRAVVLRYGDSKKFTYYGLASFVKPTDRGDLAFESPAVRPNKHRRLTGPTRFEVNGMKFRFGFSDQDATPMVEWNPPFAYKKEATQIN